MFIVKISGAQAISMNLLQLVCKTFIIKNLRVVLHSCKVLIEVYSLQFYLDVKKGKDLESIGSGVRRPMRALEKGPMRQSAV